MKIPEKLKSDPFIILYLAILWIALISIINPLANYPSGDDWAYAKPVRTLLQTGTIQLTDWSSMFLVAQVYLGALFSLLFGFSFDTLRFLALILSFSGVAGSYLLFRKFMPDKTLAIISTMMIFLNPNYFINSFSFMTDVPFYGLVIWSIYFFVKFIENDRLINFLIATILIFISMLIREVAITIVPAFAIVYLFKKGLKPAPVIYSLMLIIIVAGTYFGYRYWLEANHGITKNLDFSRNVMIQAWTTPYGIAKSYIYNIYLFFVYIGLWFLPIILALFKIQYHSLSVQIRRKAYLIIPAAAIGALVITKIPRLFYLNIMFLVNGFFNVEGFMTDVLKPSQENIFFIPDIASYFFLFLSLTGAFLLIFMLSAKIHALAKVRKNLSFRNFDQRKIFLLIIFITYLFIIFTQNLMNRYLIYAFPMFLTLIMPQKAEINKSLKAFNYAIIIFLLMNLYISVATTHDMLSDKRNRAEAAVFLEKNNIMPDSVDGGFEYNAWNLYDWNYKITPEKNWWWVHGDEYLIKNGTVSNYQIVKEYSYRMWLPPNFEGKTYILKRQ